jgi:NAD(P)H-hydrate epimerase
MAIKIFPCSSVRKLDAYTIEHENISSIELMERTARKITETIMKRWFQDVPIVVFAGPGDNGGDALAVARLLMQQEYKVETFLFNTKQNLSPNCQTNKDLLEEVDGVVFKEVNTTFNPPNLTEDYLVIDGLFGTGLKGVLNGGFAAVVQYINGTSATVVSLDVPSGLTGEETSLHNMQNHIVHADFTYSMQLPKLSFLFPENEEIVGEWELLDIGLSLKFIEEMETDYVLIEEEDVRQSIKLRKKFAHKGDFGHGLLVAGSYGMAGASILSARACLRSGIGKLTVHAPICNNDILQVSIPEAIIEHDADECCFSEAPDMDGYQALGIGPGLGTSKETEDALLNQLKNCQVPAVIDADALTLLAENREALKSLPSNSILTPHPKELERLIGKCNSSYERLVKTCELTQTFGVYILLKGAYSILITPQGKCFFNPTGNTGMATAGSGDVLTGIILALLAQEYSTEKAGIIGTYIHGLAGDIAREKYGMISLTAGDIVHFLPEAWKRMDNQ